jgi:hypothetical protein
MAAYEAKFEQNGGVVEERIVGVELLSPSVQLRVMPDRSVELLSTHDQLLGGTSGQSYLGCIFPADRAYSRLISAPAITIAERLAREGALGRFAIDFVVKRDTGGRWSAYAIELNLRKGGTTHPFLTLQFLTDGSYDGASGRFLLPGGAQRHLVATDHFESSELRALAVEDLFDIVARHGLHFDQSRQAGVVFHMISSLTEHGRIGLRSGSRLRRQCASTSTPNMSFSPRQRRPGRKVGCQGRKVSCSASGMSPTARTSGGNGSAPTFKVANPTAANAITRGAGTPATSWIVSPC